MQVCHVTYRDIKATFGISSISIYKIFHEHWAVKKICSRWITHNFTKVQNVLMHSEVYRSWRNIKFLCAGARSSDPRMRKIFAPTMDPTSSWFLPRSTARSWLNEEDAMSWWDAWWEQKSYAFWDHWPAASPSSPHLQQLLLRSGSQQFAAMWPKPKHQ